MTARLSRTAASLAVADDGWRFLLGSLRTAVRVDSIDAAVHVAARAVAAAGDGAADHLQMDLRRDVVVIGTQSQAGVTERDVEIATAITVALRTDGFETAPGGGPDGGRSVQLLEIAIDTTNVVEIRSFWKAVLDYVDDPRSSGPSRPLVDPLGQGPAVWFQTMDPPRLDRNRIHVDVSVPHDVAAARIEAALGAGGHLISDDRAPSFWVLGDPEGNEVCITTWQGRDG